MFPHLAKGIMNERAGERQGRQGWEGQVMKEKGCKENGEWGRGEWEEEEEAEEAEPRINKHLFVRFFENKFLL